MEQKRETEDTIKDMELIQDIIKIQDDKGV